MSRRKGLRERPKAWTGWSLWITDVQDQAAILDGEVEDVGAGGTMDRGEAALLRQVVDGLIAVGLLEGGGSG